MSWFIYALSASVVWGLGYVLSEKVMQDGVSPSFIMIVSCVISLPLYFLISYFDGNFKASVDVTLSKSSVLWMLIVMSVLVVGGNFLILMSVAEKNATLASIIEITYPIFTLFFAWLILKEVQINLLGLLGSALIFAGVIVVLISTVQHKTG